jgi:hypothetical protein
MALWYIDALDARAGIGLATYREADLNTNTVDLGRPGVFISPPFFQGESVASRAIGFAATRGSFQLGLFVEAGEIAFATLQGVCEFIRRVYISSGGGDTDNGISRAPIVPNPESGGGEFGSLTSDEASAARKMVKFVATLKKDIDALSTLKYSNSEPTELNRHESSYKKSLLETLKPLDDFETLLAYGCAVLIEELILRFPFRTAEHAAWMRSMMKLGQMLHRLGLVGPFFHSPNFNRISKAAYSINRKFKLFNGNVRDFDVILQAMLGLNPYFPWHPRLGSPFWGGWSGDLAVSEPLDDLSLFPIPSVAAKQVGLNPVTASVRDLLSVFLADPTILEGKASRPETSMIVAFILLSSMLIVSGGQASLAPIEGTRIGGLLRQDVLRNAISWMDSQMPGYLFHRDVEKCIRGAAQLRYAARLDAKVSSKTGSSSDEKGDEQGTRASLNEASPSYYAQADILSGHFEQPFEQELKSASVVMADTTGSQVAQVGPFQLEGIVSFQSGSARVHRSKTVDKAGEFSTSAVATIDHLNILDIITADRVVAQVSTTTANSAPGTLSVPAVSFRGTHFENLRIEGRSIEIAQELDILGPTPRDGISYLDDRGVLERIKRQYEMIDAKRDAPEWVRRFTHGLKFGGRINKANCSLVNEVNGLPGQSFGHMLEIPQFGRIFLEELTLERQETSGQPDRYSFSLTMIRLELEGVARGSVKVAIVNSRRGPDSVSSTTDAAVEG